MSERQTKIEDYRSRLTRRGLVAATAGLAAAWLAGCKFSTKHPLRGQTWLSAAATGDTKGASVAQAGERVQFLSCSNTEALRGHGITQHPKRANKALVFARRPGDRAFDLDLATGQYREAFVCHKNRHLFGHGCYNCDGSYLFTTEANIVTGQGLVVVRRADNYSVEAEYVSHGIGPHEIKFMPDGKRLVVANGGLLTHPDHGRAVLNLESMDSNLAYLSVNSGELLDQVRVPEAKASIRHLDVARNGEVVVAMQIQRGAADHNNTVPLAAVHRFGQSFELVQTPVDIINRFNDYAGSVVVNNMAHSFGITSPRGNLAAFWSMKGEFLGAHSFHDVCGIALTREQDYFVLSSSVGELRFIRAADYLEATDLRIATPGVRWDNHLMRAVDYV